MSKLIILIKTKTNMFEETAKLLSYIKCAELEQKLKLRLRTFIHGSDRRDFIIFILLKTIPDLQKLSSTIQQFHHIHACCWKFNSFPIFLSHQLHI